MPIFPGYLRHALIEDLDDPGHLFVISEWESREAADKVLTDYAGSPNARPGERARLRAAPPHCRASPGAREVSLSSSWSEGRTDLLLGASWIRARRYRGRFRLASRRPQHRAKEGRRKRGGQRRRRGGSRGRAHRLVGEGIRGIEHLQRDLLERDVGRRAEHRGGPQEAQAPEAGLDLEQHRRALVRGVTLVILPGREG